MAQQYDRYGLTAARKHGRPGRETRPAGPTIDIHAHAAIPAAAAFAAPHLSHAASNAPAETQALNRQQSADRKAHLEGIDERLAVMDDMGVDIQVVTPAPNQCYHELAPEAAVEAARLVNDGIAALCARRPDRLVPFGTAPLQAGEAGAAELERCVRELGFKGVEILAHVGAKEISDPAHAPFWAKAEALGVLVFIHPSGYPQPDRLGPYYFNNVIGNPLDTTVAVHHLIFDGVMERHPGLKVLAVHGGGYLPAYSGRIDHAWGARPDSHAGLPQPPTTYLRRMYFDTIVFTPHQLEYLVSTFGADRILMGTDYPYDMGEYDPLGHIAGTSLDEASRTAIVGGNASALLGLG